MTSPVVRLSLSAFLFPSSRSARRNRRTWFNRIDSLQLRDIVKDGAGDDASFQAMTEPFLHPVSGEMFSATAYPLNICPRRKNAEGIHVRHALSMIAHRISIGRVRRGDAVRRAVENCGPRGLPRPLAAARVCAKETTMPDLTSFARSSFLPE